MYAVRLMRFVPSGPYNAIRCAARKRKRRWDVPLSLEEKVRLLSMVDVFEVLSEEELEELAHLALDATYERGEALHEPEERDEKLYVLKEGRVQLYVTLPNEGEITLSVVEGGSIFGEIAFVGEGAGEIHARALVDSLVCTLKTEIIEQLIERNPGVGLAMVRMLSERLLQAEVRLAELAHKQVPARLASLILRLSASEGVVTREGVKIDTPYTHQQLGTMINATRASVTRAMSELQAQGTIQVVRRRIHLRDREALEREAEARPAARGVPS
jgi:CRP/FNR family transcriptional regulator, cyclic AMP receptor protein